MSEIINFNETNLGTVEIAPEVIQLIAGIATSEVAGVVSINGGVVSDLNQLFRRKNIYRGIAVHLNDELKIEMSITVEYGNRIPDLAREVQEKVKNAVESMTGLQVEQILVRVEGVRLPPESTE
ncbi:Asp23/Gls24 family envelope stress response protein [Hazenella sp. IB182357]|uniref:Asp23/Gls24 family envelope stress response protein n=1 Tax=Polycladospora coralii TaxID=2771432 RepID=A0A926NH58_9BACL|nr:Asp23/Gls24 family envelope stress response protein [Polycladospora coralii]MBD1373248.1 Asp23/Gls24 family envelope stress response protein [Polycladospora coralii]MBS7530906.1 Asp23/Gls24 family envelope stress response protein [Polycladospora coralii]